MKNTDMPAHCDVKCSIRTVPGGWVGKVSDDLECWVKVDRFVVDRARKEIRLFGVGDEYPRVILPIIDDLHERVTVEHLLFCIKD